MRKAAMKLPLSMNDMVQRAGEVATLLGTMANPIRLLILCSLVEGEKPVHELVANSGISQGAVSQHLAKMRNLKLVSTRRDGQTIHYALASTEVKLLLASLHGIFCAGAEGESK